MKSYAGSTVEQVVLQVQQICAQQRVPYELVADGHLDMVTDSMLVQIRAHIWGEKRETLVQVPDGFWEYVKRAIAFSDYTPGWLKKRIKVRFIDWEACVFRAYPDFKAPKLYGPQFDRCVVHTLRPLNLTALSS